MSGKDLLGARPESRQSTAEGQQVSTAAPSFLSDRSFVREKTPDRTTLDACPASSDSDAPPIEVFRLDTAGNILSRHGRIGGGAGGRARADQLLGHNCLDLCAAIAAAGNPRVDAVAQHLRDLLARRTDEFQCVLRHAGRTFQVQAMMTGGAEPVLLLVQDVTEFVQAREALAEAHGLPQHGAGDPGALAEMRRELSVVTKEIRTLSYLLYPPTLVSDGLAASLEELARGFRARACVDVHLSLAGELDALPAPLQHAVLQIVQEALINAHRHADATEVEVSVALGRRGLTIKIADDGPGAALKDFTPGVGLRGMRARAVQLGGRLSVRPGPRGAILAAFFPASALGAPAAAGDHGDSALT